MTRHDRYADANAATNPPPARAPLPPRSDTGTTDALGMTHDQLVAALRAVEGMVDVGQDPPNFKLKGQAFLHFHRHDEGMYADVRFEKDFEPVWVSTPNERSELLARVCDHVERLHGSKKRHRRRPERSHDR